MMLPAFLKRGAKKSDLPDQGLCTSTSQGSPPHCRGSPAQVKHLDPYPIAEVHQHKSRDRHPIAEVSTASQPHCRGRYSQHRNPIAEGPALRSDPEVAASLLLRDSILRGETLPRTSWQEHNMFWLHCGLTLFCLWDSSSLLSDSGHPRLPSQPGLPHARGRLAPDLRSTCGTSDRKRSIAQSTVKSQAVGGGMPAPEATSRSPSALPGSPWRTQSTGGASRPESRAAFSSERSWPEHRIIIVEGQECTFTCRLYLC